MPGKRQDYIGWDELFIAMAAEAAWRSKDPRTQNGACIVSADHTEIAIGYNGFPKLKNKDNDEVFPWIGEGEEAMTERYKFVVHAERNCLDNAKFDLDGSTLYLFSERGYYPCETCAQGILSKGVSAVVMGFAAEGDNLGGSARYGNQAFAATLKMFEAAEIKVRILGPDMARYCYGLASRFLKVAAAVEALHGAANEKC